MSMVLRSPLYTILRYAFQAWGVFSGKGAAGAYAREESAISLLSTLFKSQWDAWIAAPGMWNERREFWKKAKLSDDEMAQLLKSNRIGVREVSLAY